MHERSRWMLLTITLILALGGGLGIALVRIAEVQRAQDRDMCDLINALTPADAPPPTTERGIKNAEALARYREHRC